MRGWAQLVLLLVALVTLLPRCQEKMANPWAQKGTTQSPVAAPEKVEPETSPTTETEGKKAISIDVTKSPFPPCRVGKVEARDLSEPAMIEEGPLAGMVLAYADREFPGSVEKPGVFKLQLQVAVREGEAEDTASGNPLRIFLGGTAHLSAPATPVDIVFETASQQDQELSPLCADDPQSNQCKEWVFQELMPPLVDEMVHHLSMRCQMEHSPDLTPFLQSADTAVRIDACRVAGDRKDPQFEELVLGLAGDESREVALACVGALALFATDKSVARLVRASTRAHLDVVRQVAVALADIGTPLALKYLRNWAQGHPSAAIRELARSLLNGTAGAPPPEEGEGE